MKSPIHRKALVASTPDLAEKRQVLVTVSTAAPDRDNDSIIQEGIDFAGFQAGKTILWNHDPNQPIAACINIGLVEGKLQALAQFPNVGASVKADEIYNLVAAGVINSASIGFLTRKEEPVDGKSMRNGKRILACEMVEFSFVSVPANSQAAIQERAMKTKTKAPGTLSRKGLYALASLASILGSLGYMAQDADWEREYEGDDSAIPEMLADICRATGAALVAMTNEEVAELLASLPMAEGVEVAAEKRVKALVAKSGRVLSQASQDTMSEACKSIMAGHDTIKSMMEGAADAPAADADGKAAALIATKANTDKRAKRLREVEILALAA